MLRTGTGTALLLLLLVLSVMPVAGLVPPGRIVVQSTPSGALACVDTSDCALTSATFTAEGDAWHTIVVTRKGYRSWVEKVYVNPEQTSVVNANLDLNPAATAIQVYLTPDSGTICLDNTQCQEADRSIGSTLFTGVSTGYHTISVDAPYGYLDATERVFVELGSISDVSIVLRKDIARVTTPGPATGAVRVYVDRTGSTICLDSTECFENVGGRPGPGTGTALFNDVSTDRAHVVTVTADGFRPGSAAVTVSKDQVSTVEIMLRPLAPVTTTLPPLTTTLTPLATQAAPDMVPLLGALALFGAAFSFRKDRH
jgi:hypothetical protein